MRYFLGDIAFFLYLCTVIVSKECSYDWLGEALRALQGCNTEE